MSMMTGLCDSCKTKLQECYRTYPTKRSTKCAFCGSPGLVWELEPKRKRKPKQITVSTGLRADHEKYVKRRSWA